MTSRKRSWIHLVATLSLLLFTKPAFAENPQPEAVQPEGPTPSPVVEQEPQVAPGSPISKPEKIGRVHDNLRRDRRRRSFFAELSDFYADYARFKNRLEAEEGFSFSVDLSYLQQWGWDQGGSPSGQFLSTPNIDFRLFKSQKRGEGSVQASYTAVRYPTHQTAAEVSTNIGVITPINDFPVVQDTFAQLTYTHALPGKKLLLTAGQYPFYSFDGNLYLANQQENFNSYIFAQNGSSTYPIAGLGAYAQLNITDQIQLAGGFQNPNDLTGATLSTSNGKDGLAWFAYAQWTPQFPRLGSAQYSFVYYEVPAIPEQGRSTGWSFNAMQNLNDTWALFGRANAAYQTTTPIRSSYALGAAMNNPLGRNKLDQIGLAMGYSTAASSPVNPPDARNEKVIEAYWNWAFTGGLLLTPSVQYIFEPALAPDRNGAWALSLRATLML